ncbi:hypothetical protein OK074_5020 [Actinobacteria bacterium OK074]|nr:hypothetical protein OK074_5020 [Actinobacteria bacterium OK074]
MSQKLDDETAAKVFAAARTASFATDNLGQCADVWVEEYQYRVIVTEQYRAYTDCRFGYGGTEFVFASATPEQDRALRIAIKLSRVQQPPPARTDDRPRHR